MKKDVVIYCDCFGKYKEYRNGCSVALVVNNIIIKRKIYLLQDFHKVKMKKFSYSVLEYFALYKALQLAKRFAQKVEIYSDSQVIVFQMDGRYNVNENLIDWYKLCKTIQTENIKIIWIKRLKLVKVLGH